MVDARGKRSRRAGVAQAVGDWRRSAVFRSRSAGLGQGASRRSPRSGSAALFRPCNPIRVRRQFDRLIQPEGIRSASSEVSQVGVDEEDAVLVWLSQLRGKGHCVCRGGCKDRLEPSRTICFFRLLRAGRPVFTNAFLSFGRIRPMRGCGSWVPSGSSAMRK